MRRARWVALSVVISGPLSFGVYFGAPEAVLATATAAAAIGIPAVLAVLGEKHAGASVLSRSLTGIICFDVALAVLLAIGWLRVSSLDLGP